MTPPRFPNVRLLIRQFHYAVGTAAVLYILFVSVTGSAIVFEHELYRFFLPDPTIGSAGDGRLGVDDLKSIIARRYPRQRIVGIWDRHLTAGTVTEVWLEGIDGASRRLIHPRTGEDLGDAQPPSLWALELMRRAHVMILTGGIGWLVHAVGALSLVALSISGIAVRRRNSSSRQMRRELSSRRTLAYHGAAGTWGGIFAAFWGVTGACFLFQPRLDRLLGDAGEPALEWIYALHAGTAAGLPMRVIWIVSAISLVFTAVTGMLVTWKRPR